MQSIKKSFKASLIVSLLALSSTVQANPVVCFDSNIGNFCVEVFETQTPGTAANFLSYIRSDAYTNGIFHRSVPGFVVQAGGFKFVNNGEGILLAKVETFPPISNEFKLSNTRGTLAMAKVSGNPDSATSQWFVNLSDNSENLDNQNGGFTVFGRVVFDGMTIVDAIESLPLANLGGELSSVPTINFDGGNVSVDNLVHINRIEIKDTTGVFNEGVLSFPVTTGVGDPLDVRLNLVASDPNIVFELDLASLTPLQTSPTNIATFSAADSSLEIPSVIIGPSTVVNNVQMLLTDLETFQFTLIGFE